MVTFILKKSLMRHYILIALCLCIQNLVFTQLGTVDHHRRSINDNPVESRTVLPILQQAQQQFLLADIENVLFIHDNAVAQNPNSAAALLSRARYKYNIGMSAEAELDVRLANNINPYIVDLYGFNGVSGILNLIAHQPKLALITLSKTEKIESYSEYLESKIQNKNLEPKVLEEYKLMLESLKAKDYEKVLEETVDLINLEPSNPVLYDLQGYLLKYFDDLDGAVDAFTLSSSIEPDYYLSWYNLGLAERELGLLSRAKLHLDKCIEIQDEFVLAYIERASVLKELGDYEGAIKDYTKVIEIKGPKYFEAYLNRGLTKMVVGDYSGAIVDLDKIIDKFPKNPLLRLNRGNLNLVFGFHDRAFNDYTNAIDLDEDYKEAYFNRGLTNIMYYDSAAGCADLRISSDLGYEKANLISTYFCAN
jgi:tetratricopeptide (TPR) repeat protein